MILNARFFLAMTLICSFFPARAQMGLEGFQTGRYEVRKTSSSFLKESPVTATDVIKPKANKRKPSAEEVAKPVSSEKLTSVGFPDGPAVTEQATKSVTTEPGLSEQMGSLFSNDADKVYDFYKAKIHQDDLRQNKVDLDFSPVIFNVDSKSNYSPRDYHSSSQGLEVGARVWLTPRIGVTGHMAFSLAGNLAEANTPNHTPTYFENLDLAARFRNFFNDDLLAKSVEFSFHYLERKTQPSTDSATRLRLKTQSLGLGLQARIPTSAEYAWVFGGVFYPRMQHSESTASAGYHSGSHEESVGLDLNFGGEWKFSRHSQILWGFEAQLEKNLFSGPANVADPVSGAIPENVSVEQGVYLFRLGYRWGH